MAKPDTKVADSRRVADPFRLLVESVTDYAIFMLDPAGRVVSWNAGAERMKGYAPDDIMGQHFSRFYTPEALARHWPEQELKLATARGRFEDEGWRVRKDGSQFWANVVITALKDERGELLGFAKITRDLTDRRLQEEGLRQSEERFRLLVENVRDYAIFMLDPEGHVMSWNAGAERMKGYRAAEAIGRHFSMFYPAEAREKKWPEQELALAREHGHFQDEGPRLRKDGSRFWANVTLTPVYDREGTLRGYAKVTRDLTDAKRVEALESAERQTNEFLAMLAHELRNPLAPISNALNLLARKPTTDPAELWVREVLQRQTGQMTRLVDDLLDVSRITRSTIQLERKPVDLGGVLRNAADAAMQWMQSRQHSLQLSVPDEKLEVTGDEVRLNQIVQNLLHNAAKYTPNGGRVELGARREGAQAVITVKDSGIGMTPELLGSAFELFKQGQQGLERPHGGLGVGLTLVRRLVDLHGGTVQGRSAGPDRGSEFIVRLPLSAGESGDSAMHAATQDSPQAPVQRRRVLIVDDNQDAANALRLLLENDGHEVKVAADGPTGLMLAKNERPDFVLLDIGLPKISGYDIARQLREDQALNDTIIVAITGYGQQHDRARTVAAGFDHHLVKPVEFSTLQRLFRQTA
jgi:PAS domain S-box-containing protein